MFTHWWKRGMIDITAFTNDERVQHNEIGHLLKVDINMFEIQTMKSCFSQGCFKMISMNIYFRANDLAILKQQIRLAKGH